MAPMSVCPASFSRVMHATGQCIASCLTKGGSTAQAKVKDLEDQVLGLQGSLEAARLERTRQEAELDVLKQLLSRCTAASTAPDSAVPLAVNLRILRL